MLTSNLRSRIIKFTNEAVREDVVATHGKLCFAESVGSVVVVPIEGFVGEDRRHKLYERH